MVSKVNDNQESSRESIVEVDETWLRGVLIELEAAMLCMPMAAHLPTTEHADAQTGALACVRAAHAIVLARLRLIVPSASQALEAASK